MRCLSGQITYSICACLGVLLAFTAPRAESPQDPVEAVWRPQRLMFQYRSEGKLYACDILEEKIRTILHGLGASERLKLRRVSCRDFALTARHEVIMESPVAATEENIRDITDYNSEDELIARVNGVQLPSAGELERFPAVWQEISIRRVRKIYLEDRDCALVQQLRRQILPKMSIEVIKDINHVDCAYATPRLTVVALVAKL